MEGLSRRHRFHARGAFGPALRSGRKVRGSVALIHIAAGRPGTSRLGIAVTRRAAPSSVVRNRMKRVVRELFRRHPAKAAGLDLVVALREGAAGLQAAAFAAEVLALLDQAMGKASR
jgi:ribonuclease P protein component